MRRPKEECGAFFLCVKDKADMQQENKSYNFISFFGILFHFCCFTQSFMTIMKAYRDEIIGFRLYMRGSKGRSNLQSNNKATPGSDSAGFIFAPVLG